MKTKVVWLVSALFTASLSLAAERFATCQLLDPVKSTLSGLCARLGQAATIRNLAGKSAYEVEIERDNALNARLLIAADGTIASDSRFDWKRLDPMLPQLPDRGIRQ